MKSVRVDLEKNLNIVMEIYKIKSSFGNDALGGRKIFGFRLKRINTNKRLFNQSLGGGAILDGGIYPVSLIVDILDQYQNDYFEKKSENNFYLSI